jgi:hypothetical protein
MNREVTLHVSKTSYALSVCYQYPKGCLSFCIPSIIDTPKGQFFSQHPHAIHSPAWWDNSFLCIEGNGNNKEKDDRKEASRYRMLLALDLDF